MKTAKILLGLLIAGTLTHEATASSRHAANRLFYSRKKNFTTKLVQDGYKTIQEQKGFKTMDYVTYTIDTDTQSILLSPTDIPISGISDMELTNDQKMRLILEMPHLDSPSNDYDRVALKTFLQSWESARPWADVKGLELTKNIDLAKSIQTADSKDLVSYAKSEIKEGIRWAYCISKKNDTKMGDIKGLALITSSSKEQLPFQPVQINNLNTTTKSANFQLSKQRGSKK